MTPGVLGIIALLLLVVVALAWPEVRRRRGTSSGPGRPRAAAESRDRQAAAELEERRRRVDGFEIVSIAPAARRGYLERWHLAQARFVDSPPDATRAAHQLISEVMHERGYPVEDFEQRAADISVDHPQVVDDYRAAHAVAEAGERSEATTEDLRQALVHYRSLFEDLLEAAGVGEGGDVVHADAGILGGAGPDDYQARGEAALVGRDDARSDDGVPPAAPTPPSQRRTTKEAR